jgi:hypothetical protein
VHVDVKDASAGVMKDLKRFQGEKEDDLKRYMVSSSVIYSIQASMANKRGRLLSPSATSNGPSATKTTGERPKKRSRMSRLRRCETIILRDQASLNCRSYSTLLQGTILAGCSSLIRLESSSSL